MTNHKQARHALAILALIQLLFFADICVLHVTGVSMFALASAACGAATLDLS